MSSRRQLKLSDIWSKPSDKMPPKRFTCSNCGEKCATKAKLEAHVKQHSKVDKKTQSKSPKTKEQICESCGEAFTSVALFKKHRNGCETSVKPKVAKKKKTQTKDSSTDIEKETSDHQPKSSDNEEFRAQMKGMFTKVQSLLGEDNMSKSLSKNARSNIGNSKSISSVPTPSSIDDSSKQADKLILASVPTTSGVQSNVGSSKTVAIKTNVLKTASRASTRQSTISSKILSDISRNIKSVASSSKTITESKRKRSYASQNTVKVAMKKSTPSPKFLSNPMTTKVSTSKGKSSAQKVANTSVFAFKSSAKLLNSDTSNKSGGVKRGRGKQPSVFSVSNQKGKKNTAAQKRKQNQRVFAKKSEKEVKTTLHEAMDDSLNEDETEQSQLLETPPVMTNSELADSDTTGDFHNGTNQQEENEVDSLKLDAIYDSEGDMKQYASQSKQYNCALCHKVFSRKYHLDRHLKLSPCSGLPPPSFPCQVCGRVYTRKDNLREHLRAHTGEVHRKKKHKCQYCNKAFHGQSLLTIHVRKHTGEKPFECEFCPKKFPSAGALTKHCRTHTGEKPFACPECGQRFSLKGTLNRHLRVHTGVRPHKCFYCGKQFIQIGGLKAHLFYHTGENGFKCEQCGKVFNRKARLQMHNLYVHEKLRPFNCEHCSKCFTRKEDLSRHAILHTGEKPFKCPTCDKSFAIKPSLKLHLLTHTKEEPRSCHECGRAFIRKDCLLRHMRKRHRDLLDKILVDEKDEKFTGETNTVNSRILNENDLCENIHELLSLLVDEPTLTGFGWPEKPVDEVLESVIRRCGHTPVSPDQYSYLDRLRENAKLLFTVVIDDNAVKTLLNNQTVDEVILHVLRLAKT